MLNMYASLVSVLLSSALVGAHPTARDNSLVARGVDLNAFRLKATSKYVNASVAESPSVRLRRREDYIETATELVKSIVKDATFRVVGDHYVGANGIAHVNFKQTAHDLDIDNADFNVNVSVKASLHADNC